MTPSEIRVKCAEACGWKQIDTRRWGGYTDRWEPLCSPADAIGAPAKYWGYVPNYPEDLNACHEMEKTLTPPQSERYAEFILDVLEIPSPFIGTARTAFLTGRATALKRCEAFLRTLGKWE